jgi:hypothetical protein
MSLKINYSSGHKEELQMKPINLLINLLVLQTILTSCASLPTQEMSDARQAIKAAHGAKAELYVPGGLLHAEQDLSQAEQDLAQGQFQQARHHALLAKKRAVTAYEASMTLEHAKIIWQTITDLDQHATNQTLVQAEAVALQGDVDNLLQLATVALQQGYQTLNQVYLAQARGLIDKWKTLHRTIYPGEAVILELAQQACEKNEGKQAVELMKSLSITR